MYVIIFLLLQEVFTATAEREGFPETRMQFSDIQQKSCIADRE